MIFYCSCFSKKEKSFKNLQLELNKISENSEKKDLTKRKSLPLALETNLKMKDQNFNLKMEDQLFNTVPYYKNQENTAEASKIPFQYKFKEGQQYDMEEVAEEGRVTQIFFSKKLIKDPIENDFNNYFETEKAQTQEGRFLGDSGKNKKAQGVFENELRKKLQNLEKFDFN
jgi:adenine-specific DNA methylase